MPCDTRAAKVLEQNGSFNLKATMQAKSEQGDKAELGFFGPPPLHMIKLYYGFHVAKYYRENLQRKLRASEIPLMKDPGWIRNVWTRNLNISHNVVQKYMKKRRNKNFLMWTCYI